MKTIVFIYLAGFLVLAMGNIALANNGLDPALVGTWGYTASDVSEEYNTGKLVISSPEEGKYECRIKFDDKYHTEKEAQDIKVAGKVLSFRVYVSGEVVDVSLTLNDCELTGKASYSEGSAFIRATRKN